MKEKNEENQVAIITKEWEITRVRHKKFMQ